MPVRRLRSLQQAEDSLVRHPDDPALWSHIVALWAFADRFSPRRPFPPGVFKSRSVAELNARRDALEAAALGDRDRSS